MRHIALHLPGGNVFEVKACRGGHDVIQRHLSSGAEHFIHAQGTQVQHLVFQRGYHFKIELFTVEAAIGSAGIKPRPRGIQVVRAAEAELRIEPQFVVIGADMQVGLRGDIILMHKAADAAANRGAEAREHFMGIDVCQGDGIEVYIHRQAAVQDVAHRADQLAVGAAEIAIQIIAFIRAVRCGDEIDVTAEVIEG